MKKTIIIAIVLSIAHMTGCTGQPNKPGNSHDNQNDPTQNIDTSTATSINQYGISWYFDKEYPSGQYANGDYWIAGDTVVLTRITPAFDSVQGEYINGWEINPIVEGGHGFNSVIPGFDISLIPTLPCTITSASSVVKTVRSDRDGPNGRESVQNAAVITVLTEIPTNNGESLFRPPYVGNEKTNYSIDDLKTDVLPRLTPSDTAWSLAQVTETFQKLQLDHKQGVTGRAIHPLDNIPDYGADIARRNNDGALALMLDYTAEEKMPALISYVQYGIDLYHMLKLGHTWPAGGGHRPGQKLPLSFAAVLLDNSDMKTAIKNHDFHEDRGCKLSKDGKTVLYGFRDYDDSVTEFERDYWDCLVYHVVANRARGFKSYPDPYGFIDGGPEPGSYYQSCCTSQPWKGTVLCCHLMPEMKELWVGDDTLVFQYVDRWVNTGIHSQPDSCAPPPQVANGSELYDDRTKFYEYMDAHYGITFGPDSTNACGCVKDTDPSDGMGRFPQLHDTKADEGGRSSAFVNAMWDKYR
jgi:hypothetical protein